MATPLIRRLQPMQLFGATAPRLPQRVRERIRGEEERAEVVVGVLQLAFIVSVAMLYALAPKKFGADAPFAPVPWVLGAYATFTLLRLGLAVTRRLTRGFVYASIVVDMVLLMGLIFSYHVQYAQPPSFSLKSPTLLWVFTLIALRSLNFQARYVATAGIVAALGWLALVVYVVRIDPADPMITRDYVSYLTSNSVLIGAEVDKILAILMFAGVLALASKRTARLVEYAALETASNQELARFVPSEVAARARTAEASLAAGEGETTEATVLFLDIEGFTTIAERMPPEDVVGTLNDFFAAASAPIAQRGGGVNQFLGDAIVATFNAPRACATHASSAIRAALDILALTASRTFGPGVRLSVRIGINTGPMVCGLLGTPDRLLYTVIGDEVNLAARLEALNKNYGTRIIVSEATRRAAGADAFPFTPIGEVQVRGRSRPTPVYSLAGPAG
ncbi:MAG TPA: adenylate/guanylate cyclase domain-containing protein [Casimicrobiaceae bacterium]|nr:adenylate/guanylate cyclase domain-containing protein [Casimicrobiaceae bacterium]